MKQHYPISVVRGRAVVLPERNIDTDRIIPARFLTTTISEGLGVHAFTDWRYHADGSPRGDCPLNDPRAQGAQVLVTGRNFGCGSSREHAAWALRDLGIRVVIASEIADIFRANATRNGILPVVLPETTVSKLAARPFEEVEIDLITRVVRATGIETAEFTIDVFARRCLLEGMDELGYLLHRLPLIETFEQSNGGRLTCTP
jgi:3-isopropylmalate/(R)-2-methylmalate dehydratase small subunit